VLDRRSFLSRRPASWLPRRVTTFLRSQRPECGESVFLAIIRQVAVNVDKIVKRAKPADLPIEQSTRFMLVINLKAAKTLGPTIPQSLLLRADEVIE